MRRLVLLGNIQMTYRNLLSQDPYRVRQWKEIKDCQVGTLYLS